MFRRVTTIIRNDLRTNLRRPMIWVWIALLAFWEWGLSTGSVTVQTSGDSSIGGDKQWLTSEFAFAQLLGATTLIIYGFFIAILCGMTIIRDDEFKIGQLLHSTPLRPGEYTAAKFTACALTILLVAVCHVLCSCLFFHVIPNAGAADIRGPFALRNYLVPMLVFGLPTLLFLAGVSFAVGEITRRPILIFVLPTLFIIVFGLFLHFWSPIWLPRWGNNLLMYIDPYGVRWLNETWLKVDRGVEFYNRQPIGLDPAFLVSRLVFCIVGVGGVVVAGVHFARTLQGRRHGALAAATGSTAEAMPAEPAAQPPRLAAMKMSQRKQGLIREISTVCGYEVKELRWSPGLYLFVPFIILQSIGQVWLADGTFGTQVLLTPGVMAATLMNTLSLLGCLLLMFYTVESQLRERITRLAPIYYASSCSSFAILLGKSLANSLVALAIVIATLIACIGILLVQRGPPLSLTPFALVWGGLLLPTYVLWATFVTFVVVLTRSRYLTYTIGAVSLITTFYYSFRGKLTWLSNWNLWSNVTWSDVSSFELDRAALVLSRTLALAASAMLIFLASRLFWRRNFDVGQTVGRLRPGRLASSMMVAAPFLLVPLVLFVTLWLQINRGYQNRGIENKQKDYWRQNLATWKDAPQPALESVQLDLKIEPPSRSFSLTGSYKLMNEQAEPMKRFALTGGTHWRDIQWTLNGQDFQPDDRSRLFVFELNEPLQKGQTVDVGFSYRGTFLAGISRNGGQSMEFILPSSVVLTCFRPSFVPVVGYLESVGVDDENRYEPKNFDERFFEDTLKPFIGTGDEFDVHIRIDSPAEYTFNSVGVKTSDEIQGDRRIVVWETDHPVGFFNLVGGRWQEKQGNHSTIFYDPKHPYNIEEISLALDAARTWYSEWFAPYPWKELRISEFASLATYAQGFPTNITFSEGIGFLTKDKPGADAAFLVTAHEAAHQWWGNLLTPGLGPGGNVLSEGAAHFSSGLLFEQVKGLRARIEFFKQIEKQYNERRSLDSERPLVLIDGSRDGDTTVQYDKGGWVFWMLLNLIGRENALQGIQQFIRQYRDNDDHPVLQDFIAAMRPYAPDPEKFDQFVDQWFFDVVVPEYKFQQVQRTADGGSNWKVTGQLKNVGTSRMPVEIAATSGERFDQRVPNPEYRERRLTVELGPGEQTEFAIECDFEPQQVLVDPDAKVLQLKRGDAVFDF